ncbi:hypothetical protein JW824_12930 [bacterium]|nr:hypothetical protein [bacterium]RQV93748.1 MAG: hypothetical protein EH221_08720 [bacterium]
MLNKFLKDISKKKILYEIASDLHSSHLEQYYFIFHEDRLQKGKDQPLMKQLDNNGIPINKTYIDVQNQDYVYFPISIGQMGLAVFHTYLKTKSTADKNRFMKFVDWFCNNAESNQKLGIRWLTNVPLPQYKNPGPWQSAFSQSRGISILLRGYQITGDQKYAETAERALRPFTIPVSDGGVTSFTKWGPFYEEYTAEVPILVLNGMIFSLCGLNDFVRVFPKNEGAKKIFNDGIQTLKNILPEYDLGYWSRYNLCKAEWYPEIDPSTLGYQRLHIIQLNMLFQLTDEPIFKTYAELFQKQDNIINIVKMYRVKYAALKKMKRL